MDVRKTLLVVLAATTLLATACGGRPPRTDGGDDEDAGCIGACSTDAGEEPENFCAGVSRDGGFVTLEQLRQLPVCGQYVNLQGVVVHSVISKASRPGLDGGATQWQGEFYVTVGDGGVGPGVYVEKFFTDPSVGYEPNVGDKLNVLGVLWEGQDNRNSARNNLHRHGYRKEIRSTFEIDGGSAKLFVTALSSGNAYGVSTVDSSFSSQGGSVQPHPELLGSYVYLPGPVELTDAFPGYLLRYNSNDGGVIFLDPTRDNYQGFEFTGGVPVIDLYNRGPSDSPSECDWRATARDAGTGKIVFPNGIGGIWETWTQVPFCAPFPACLESGFVVLPDGGRETHINAIYPVNCPRDMDGGVFQP